MRPDGLETASFLNGLVFYAPVALLVRTNAGVTTAACFSLGFLLINFFYADRLLACGLREELMSPIIMAYSVTQMFAGKGLDRIGKPRCRIAMLGAVLLPGMAMVLFAFSRMTVTVVAVMVLLLLLLSFPGAGILLAVFGTALYITNRARL